MLRLALPFLILALALSGCSSSAPSPDFTALQNSGPKAGTARIVVLYPARFLTRGEVLDINLNGVPYCKLQSGRYMVREVAPGDQALKFSFCGLASSASLRVAAKAGQSYYIRVTPYDSSLVGKLSGYPPKDVLPFETAPVGPFELKLLKEQEAMAELADMTKSP